MSIITSQNWDGVTAPSAIITGWTVESGWATTTGRSRSSPNSFATSANFSGYKFLTYNTPDGNAGNVTATANFYLDNTQRDNGFAVLIRGSSTPLSASNTFYGVEVQNNAWSSGNWSIQLFKQISGLRTSLASITSISTSAVHGGWYQLQLIANGTSLAVILIRGSDGKYLDSTGTFGSPTVTAIAATDTSIAGSGYCGLYAWGKSSNGSAVYTDDYALNTSGSHATISANVLSGATGISAGMLRSDSISSLPPLPSTGLLTAASIEIQLLSLSGASALTAPAIFQGWTAIASPVIASGALTTVSLSTDWVTTANAFDKSGTLSASSFSNEIIVAGVAVLGNPGTLASSTILIGSGVAIAMASIFDRAGSLAAPYAAFDFGISAGCLTAGMEFGTTSFQLHETRSVGPASVLAVGSLPDPIIRVGTKNIVYNVYRNDGSGGPIDYLNPVATTSFTSWVSSPLAYPGDWKFGVRALQVDTGLEEKNLDAAVELILDSSGTNVSGRPVAPSGLRAIPRARGEIRVEWGYLRMKRERSPMGFRIYLGLGGEPDYTSPVTSVAYVLGRTSYLSDLTGLTSGETYSIGVRAFNAAGEEANRSSIPVTSDAIGPEGVDTLTAMPTATQGDGLR